MVQAFGLMKFLTSFSPAIIQIINQGRDCYLDFGVDGNRRGPSSWSIETRYLKPANEINRESNPVTVSQHIPKHPLVKKPIGEIKFRRHAGNQVLYLKIDPIIADLFKTPASETSTKYKNDQGEPLKFYNYQPWQKEVMRMFDTYTPEGVLPLDNYGTELVRNHGYNFSCLRTVGLAEGISLKTDGLITDEYLDTWLNILTLLLKLIYQTHISDKEINVTINLEV